MTAIVLALVLMQQGLPDLDTVLARATAYVSHYEGDLGNLIGSEEYMQNSIWLDNGTHPGWSNECSDGRHPTF